MGGVWVRSILVYFCGFGVLCAGCGHFFLLGGGVFPGLMVDSLSFMQFL